jgi:hypothetical protein
MNYEKISFLSLSITEYLGEYAWFKANVDPTYIDTTDLNEHLFSVDAEENPINGLHQELPPFIEAFLKEVKAVSEEVSYIRFVNY